MSATTATQRMPDEFSPRHWRRRLLQIAGVVAIVVVVVVLGPGLGKLRDQLGDATPGWVAAGVGFELLSVAAFVVIFRAVFCAHMSWRLSYEIAMSEQAANSVLPASGAGGLALGAWALRRGGMSTEHIGRRSVAFFFLTSLANVGGVIVFALLFLAGVLDGDRDPALTYVFGAAALLATLFVLALPRLLRGRDQQRAAGPREGRRAAVLRFVRVSLGQGIPDALSLVRRRPVPVLAGSIGTMAFDLAVLGATFDAFGHNPPFGVLVLGYLIGQLGGNIPLPGGIGGIDGGLIGVFALYHQPLTQTAAAVLVYHAISLWIPALLGSVAFVQLRNTLRHEVQPEAMCGELAEPLTEAPTGTPAQAHA